MATANAEHRGMSRKFILISNRGADVLIRWHGAKVQCYDHDHDYDDDYDYVCDCDCDCDCYCDRDCDCTCDYDKISTGSTTALVLAVLQH